MSVSTRSIGTRRNAHERLPIDQLPPTEVVPLKHPFRIASAAVVLLIGALGLHSVVTNDNFQWGRVWFYLFDPQILSGLRSTLILTVCSMSMGLVLGVILAVFRVSKNRVLSYLAGLYLWFFRGTPLLIQLIFWFNFAALYPRLSIGIPFGGPEFIGGSTNEVLTVWVVALLALSLNEAAYMAEIIRGGLLAVPSQQTEAAQALGMSQTLVFRRIILPQALRVIIPRRATRSSECSSTARWSASLRLPTCSTRRSSSTRRTSKRFRCSSWCRFGTCCVPAS
ncbi:amino acid ABC transporter permease [Mycobacterium sp. MS1601]|uniref:amino acid ABC transporter permease n=1 Tax=Mycobacterium sp. MS1601 TaxID=1936029 RepID=UPI001F1DEC31|nr:amino acid ABC transporter permease [Mycobacterium sp. MS1601]